MLIVEVTIRREDGKVIYRHTGDAFSSFQWQAAPCCEIIDHTFSKLQQVEDKLDRKSTRKLIGFSYSGHYTI